MSYKLVSAEGEQQYELRPGAGLLVGRAINSDIPIFDATVSRRHAEITFDETGILVRDLASSNGTYINGSKIDRGRITHGDVITFGKVAFRVREFTPTPASVATQEPMASDASPSAGRTIVRPLALGDARPDYLGVIRSSGGHRAVDQTSPGVVRTDRAQHTLRYLIEISKELSATYDVDGLLDRIVKHTFDLLEADRVAIELIDDQGELVPKRSRDVGGSDADRAIPRAIALTAVRDCAVILTDNASEDMRFTGHSIVMQKVRSAICAPLVGSERRALGVLYVDNLSMTHRFGEDDLELMIAFSGIAAVAIENSKFAERIRRESVVRSNFERFFAPSLAARIASSPDASRLGGEKRRVAVLFSDIRGFTALSESMKPDDMASLLTEYFTEMVDCVFRHGGTLDKFIGDAVMAQWGAPIGEDDDADRAVAAAGDMMLALSALNARWASAGRPQLEIGIGLGYGEVFAGNIGSERRLEFTVIGDTVNTASRLCSAAEGGEILISDEMRRALTRKPKLERRPPLELKGKAKPVPVFRLIA
ncbi:MAG: adenylate/guanylate cyclase domain-containing protein [Gemmatimonadaceae bacterium]